MGEKGLTNKNFMASRQVLCNVNSIAMNIWKIDEDYGCIVLLSDTLLSNKKPFDFYKILFDFFVSFK